jgi:multicomponent Na+:H+ antiporter subunit G
MMYEIMLNVISYIFIAAGVFFMITGGLGLIRMPDFFTRLHPAGMIDSIAAPLIFLGLMIQDGFTLFSGKLLLLAAFIFITSPTACHALAKAAFLSDIFPQARRRK